MPTMHCQINYDDNRRGNDNTVATHPATTFWTQITPRAGLAVLMMAWMIITCEYVVIVVDASTVTIPQHTRTNDHLQLMDPSSFPCRIFRAKFPQLSNHQLWMYRGTLYDPIDGRAVATVQGLEFVRPVYNTSGLAIDKVLRSHGLQPCSSSSSQVHQQSTTVQSSNSDDSEHCSPNIDAVTVWSQKVFCYTTRNPSGVNNNGQTSKSPAPSSSSSSNINDEVLLTNVRIRPQSPRKILPLDQVVSVFETATTYIETGVAGGGLREEPTIESTPPSLPAPSSSVSPTPGTVILHSEWPSGQTVWNAASVQSLNDPSCNPQSPQVDFAVYAKLRSRSSHNWMNPPLDLLFPPSLGYKDGGRDQEIIIGPKRSKLVQFGSSTMDENNKVGARETYSYRNIPSSEPITDYKSTDGRERRQRWLQIWPFHKSSWNIKSSSHRPSSVTIPTMSYTRYGEGPVWFAPGRHCLLELQGRPIKSLDDATPVLRNLVCSGGPVTGFGWDNGADRSGSIQEAWGLTKRSNADFESMAFSMPTQLKLSVPDFEHVMDPTQSKVKRNVSLFLIRVKRSGLSVCKRLREASMLQVI